MHATLGNEKLGRLLKFGAVGYTSTDIDLDRVSVPSPIAIDILMDTMARDRAHMYLFSV